MSRENARELLRNFSRRSVCSIALFCVVLSFAIPGAVYLIETRSYLKDSESVLALFLERHLNFNPALLLEDPETSNHVIKDIEFLMSFGGFTDFRVWGADSTLIYSYVERGLIGKKFPENRELAETLRTGKVRSGIERPQKAENYGLAGRGRAGWWRCTPP